MKYGIMQCWSDFNKGDLAIIESTIQGIRATDTDAAIHAISCFDFDDERFSTDHVFLKKSVDTLNPAIFGLLKLKLFGVVYSSTMAKLIAFCLLSFRIGAVWILPPKYWHSFLNSREIETLKVIESCDVLISKGGSFLDCTSSIRDRVGLFRVLFFFLMIKKMGKRYYILGQSIGPVYGKWLRKILNRVLKDAESVFLRETICLKEYPYIVIPASKIGFSNDSAFLLSPSKELAVVFNREELNVGITLRSIENDPESYFLVMCTAISYLVEKHNAKITIFPQVSMKTDTDARVARDIIAAQPDRIVKNIVILGGNYSPSELKRMYGEMDLFIGTRLHSTIFAIGMGVPSIGLVYQGIKAQGIFENIGIADMIVKDLRTTDEMIKKIDYVLSDLDQYSKMCLNGAELAKSQTMKAIESIVCETRASLVDKSR